MSAPPYFRAIRPGNSKLLLGGRLVLGTDARNLPLTLALLIGPMAAFCYFVARHLMKEFPDHAGISIMVVAVVHTCCVVVLLLVTAFRDPGILPRKCGNNQQDDSGQQQQEVEGRMCHKCDVYRPLALRSSHCSICDNCADRFDHHCPWLGQCIARRNYPSFYMFIMLCTLLCFFVIAMCGLHIKKLMDRKHGHTTVWNVFKDNPASILLMVYGFLASWFLGGLSVFHTYLISTNQTTLEFFRPPPDALENNNKGMIGNFKEVLCSRIPPSKPQWRHAPPNTHVRHSNWRRELIP